MKWKSLAGLGIVLLAGAGILFPVCGAPLETKVKALLFVGGKIHDHHNIGLVVEKALKESGHFEVTKVENDLDCLSAPKLDPYDVVIFHYTIGTISEAQKRGLMNFVAGGKGWVGFHSAADSFRGDPDYRAFVGGHFITHPRYRKFQVSITEEKSPITEGMIEFCTEDEQYILDFDPRVKILATALYKGKAHPVAWTKGWGKGRVFYTGLGHDPKACENKDFQTLLIRGALWSAGVLK